MHTSPGRACEAGTTFQPSAFSRLAVPATVLSCQLIRPASCSTAVTKLAQFTLLGTQESIGSSPLVLRSPALRPRKLSASCTTQPSPASVLPVGPPVGAGPEVEVVPSAPGAADAPGSRTCCPGWMRSGLVICGLAPSSADRPMPFAAAMAESVSPLRTVWVPPEPDRLRVWPGKIT